MCVFDDDVFGIVVQVLFFFVIECVIGIDDYWWEIDIVVVGYVFEQVVVVVVGQ